MKILLTFSLIFILPSLALAQKSVPDYGKIDKADLTLSSCSFEPSANAMKLFDVQDVEFYISNYDTHLTTERRVRIKIFNPKGYEYASIKIPYFSKRGVGKIKDLSGVVYSLDSAGNIITQKLSKKDFFKEKAEDNIGIVNFTFPNVKSGSVIEFRYTKIEKGVIQIDPWIPQDDIPVAYASTVLITPSVGKLVTKTYGADTISQILEKLGKGEYAREKRTYFKENINSFEPEPFMSSYKDNLLKIVFLLLPQDVFYFNGLDKPALMWKYTGNRLLNSPDFGGQVIKKISGTEGIIDSAKKISLTADRIGFLYEAVKKRIPDKTEQTLYPNDLQDAWDNRTGNTAEINLILLNLLQKVDVICSPILVSTRENGRINVDFPSAGQLNGVDVIAQDSTTFYVMDASLKYQSYLNPPFNVLNRVGYLLDPGNMQWVNITDTRSLLRQNLNIIAFIKEDGTIEGSATALSYDYAKSYALDSTSDDDDKEKFEEKKPVGLKIISTSFENAENDYEPLTQKIDFKYEPQNTGDFYFINPQILTSKKETPFVKQNRNSDIDFGCSSQETLMLDLDIPSDFEIEHLPKNLIVRAPDSSFFFKRSFSSTADHIFFSQTFEIKEPIFDKSQYKGVQEFFERAYQLMSEEIVLKRKK